MNRLIIKAHDGISDQIATYLVMKVIEQGLISDNNTQYPYLTVFSVGSTPTVVSCDKTKTGFSFNVYAQGELE